MPEGDTILRAARTLARALEGRTLTGFRSSLPRVEAAGARLAGRRIERVEARGKNLLIFFEGVFVDGGSSEEKVALETHMGMTGSWHIYRPGERWRKPAHLARAVLETDAYVAVCFQAPVVEVLTERELPRHRTLSTLGPDVLAPDFDAAEAVRRLRALGDTPIGEALLAQSAVAGIGNIYKSEALFATRTNPFAPVSSLRVEALERLLATARKQMSANLGPGVRRTRTTLGGPRFRIYRRSGHPCPSCGEPIRMRRQGLQGRSTYWCPGCQDAPSDPEV
jgi:endonuclease-8